MSFFDRKQSRLDFEHVSNSDMTICDQKMTYNECDRSCNVVCTRKTVARLYEDLQLQMGVLSNLELATLYDRCTITIKIPSHASKYFQARHTYRQGRSMANRGREAHVPLEFF